MGYPLQMARQKNPERPQLAITEEWRRRVDLALEAKAMSRASLAGKLGCSSSALTTVLNGHQEVSTLVRPISVFLGIPEPMRTPGDNSAISAEIVRVVEKLSEDEARLILEFIESLTATRETPKD